MNLLIKLRMWSQLSFIVILLNEIIMETLWFQSCLLTNRLNNHEERNPYGVGSESEWEFDSIRTEAERMS